jgi:hypothetical protein
MNAQRHLAELRITAHRLAAPTAATPAEAAAQLATAQGQHLGGVMASIAQRTRGGTYAGVAEAFGRGELVRGYPMRGTVFAVSADDLAWQTALTSERQLRAAEKRRRAHGLDDLVDLAADVARATIHAAQSEAASKAALAEAWGRAGIPTDDGRTYHLVFTLMARGDLAYGPIDAGEQLVVDAETWLPESGTLEARFNGSVDDALANWLRTYLESHGPATLRDFAWWTKLPLTQIRRVAAAATAGLEQYGDLDGEPLWGRVGLEDEHRELGTATLRRGRLLAPFDELVLGYADRTFIIRSEHHPQLVPGNNGVFKNGLLRGGEIVGTWSAKRRAAGDELVATPFGAALSATALREFERGFAAYPHPS